MDTKWGKGDGMNWEIRIDIYTLYIYIYTLIYIHIYTIYIFRIKDKIITRSYTAL